MRNPGRSSDDEFDGVTSKPFDPLREDTKRPTRLDRLGAAVGVSDCSVNARHERAGITDGVLATLSGRARFA